MVHLWVTLHSKTKQLSGITMFETFASRICEVEKVPRGCDGDCLVASTTVDASSEFGDISNIGLEAVDTGAFHYLRLRA